MNTVMDEQLPLTDSDLCDVQLGVDRTHLVCYDFHRANGHIPPSPSYMAAASSSLTIKYSFTVLFGMYLGSKMTYWMMKASLPKPVNLNDLLNEEVMNDSPRTRSISTTSPELPILSTDTNSKIDTQSFSTDKRNS